MKGREEELARVCVIHPASTSSIASISSINININNLNINNLTSIIITINISVRNMNEAEEEEEKERSSSPGSEGGGVLLPIRYTIDEELLELRAAARRRTGLTIRYTRDQLFSIYATVPKGWPERLPRDTDYTEWMGIVSWHMGHGITRADGALSNQQPDVPKKQLIILAEHFDRTAKFPKRVTRTTV